MSTSTDVKWVADLRELIALRQNDPQWVTDMRQRHLDVLADLAWPERQKTPLRGRHLDLIPLGFPSSPSSIPQSLLDTVKSPAYMAFANGELQELVFSDDAARQGVIVAPLASAVTEQRQLAEPLLGHIMDEPANRAEALNAAMWDSGAFIHIPADVKVLSPILILHYADSARTRRFVPRTLIHAGPNSRVTVIERYVSSAGDDKLLFTGGVEILAEEGAHIHYGSLQTLSPNTEVFIRRQAEVHHDANVVWSIGEFGGGLTVATDETRLVEPGARSANTMVFFGSRAQRQDFDTRIIHAAPHTNSNIVAKGVMTDRARSSFTGVTDIRPGAIQSDGRQKEQTLMLSDAARADAVPSLLINENDVYAAHSASTGPIDKVALFYLMARGLSEAAATRLFVHGFLAPVIEAIPLEILRNSVWESVEGKLAE